MARWFERLIKTLKAILDKPPYLVFVFISTVFMVASINLGRYFDQIFVLFLYSIVGLVWRYIEKDIDGGLEKYIKNKKEKGNLNQNELNNEKTRQTSVSHLLIIVVYHIGNIGLFLALLYYLNLI